MTAFMITALVSVTDESAGAKHILALSTICMALGFLTFLFSSILVLRHRMSHTKRDQAVMHIANDVSVVFRPLSRFVLVFLITMGVLEEVSVDWGGIVIVASFVALGIAFAMSSLVKDLFSYFFIRLDDHFEEGEFVYSKGELTQIEKITWRYVIGVEWSSRTKVYIPNSELVCEKIRCQSRDFDRFIKAQIPIPFKASGQALEAILRDGWEILRSTDAEGFTFKASDGTEYENQVDTPKSTIYLTKMEPHSGSEFGMVILEAKLFGLYSFSKPPPWKGDPQLQPPKEDRQLEWETMWNYQVEWLILGLKKIIDRHVSGVPVSSPGPAPTS